MMPNTRLSRSRCQTVRLNLYESMLVMSFYTIGNRYQIYSGVLPEDAVTTVIYVNAADQTVISRSDSTSVETFSQIEK